MVYETWHALAAGAPAADTVEYPLYTDAHLVGEVAFGPYELLNAAAGSDHEGRVPAAFLRVTHHMPETDAFDMSTTDDERHHGGSFENELAALLALCCGIRLFAGGFTRWFRAGGDPRGRPFTRGNRGGSADPPSLLRTRHHGLVLPALRGERQLNGVSLVAAFALLQANDASAVVRVARLYQDAVWLAESQPELAWLLLVSAVETAANHEQPADDPPEERLRAWRPQLAELLADAGGGDLLAQVAEHVAPAAGSTGKFIRFLLNFAPDPPTVRPPAHAQVPWSKSKRRAVFSKIYEYRSRALHRGKPFPTPMGYPPHRWEDGSLSERPEGLAAGVYGSVWMAEDIPMLLHTFEHIARQALLNWWHGLLPPADVSTPPDLHAAAARGAPT
ncbi:MAG TPA: hypothetical protein VFS41_03790 [Edaphobacter sp.]|nr:hypothetical protein [Edaphobacter sp.]